MMVPVKMDLSDHVIQAAIDKALNNLPPGKSGAVVAACTPGGTFITVAAKINDNWHLMAEVAKPYDGPVDGIVAIRGSW